MGTTTTTFALNKPTVGGDDNAWGGDWNQNADKIDDLLDGTTAISPNLTAGAWKVGGTAILPTGAELNFVDGVTSAIQTQLDARAPLASPALTGTPTAPTATVGTNTTQLATTAYVNAEIANDAPTKTGGGASGTWSISITGNAATATSTATLTGLTSTVAELNFVDGVTSNIQTQFTAKANLASPTFTGTVALPAATVADAVTTTADNDGTFTTGTYTPTPVGGNMKRIVNGGAFTLAAPSAAGDYTLVIQITNTTGAGAITLSGFDKTAGSPFTTTSGDDFFVFITKCNGFEFANVVALQ
jgi:hypothetical protein